MNDCHRKIKASGSPLFPLLAKYQDPDLSWEGMKGWSVLAKPTRPLGAGKGKTYPSGAGQVPSIAGQDYPQKCVMNQKS
ncbi:MAG: hypothetical protein H8E82_04745 [Candidatus Marinimicrobia bacterium]|nr:hypothetical protein [Candidatus Neomarinimicrobiota bacterium]